MISKEGGAPQRPSRALTTGERKAWRLGFLAGVEHSMRQLELFRIRFAARGIEIRSPELWPTPGAR